MPRNPPFPRDFSLLIPTKRRNPLRGGKIGLPSILVNKAQSLEDKSLTKMELRIQAIDLSLSNILAFPRFYTDAKPQDFSVGLDAVERDLGSVKLIQDLYTQEWREKRELLSNRGAAI